MTSFHDAIKCPSSSQHSLFLFTKAEVTTKPTTKNRTQNPLVKTEAELVVAVAISL